MHFGSQPDRARNDRPALSATAFLLLALGLSACSEPPERLNVVLITLDTFRADALGIYGNMGGHSPNIDSFAAESTVFANAVTPIGTTHPSHASMMTGLYPKRHGVRWNGDALDDGLTTLAEILAGNGYETAAFISLDSMLRRGGLGQGFSDTSHPRKKPPPEALPFGDDVNKLARSWLDRRSAEPFFLWLHYFETHAPYRESEYSRQQIAATGYEGVLGQGASVEMLRTLGDDVPWSAENRAALRALYDGEVREVDRLVGEVIADLRERELLSSTVVVLTADHGEALGEHDSAGHGFLLWQPILHVPLIVKVPGDRNPPRVETRVSLIDLAPTILDVLDLAGPANLDGLSFAAALSGAHLPPRPYFAEVRAVGKRKFRTRADSDRFAVFDGELKATWEQGSFRVFDLEENPQELVDTPTDLSETRRRGLQQLLSAYRKDVIASTPDEIDEDVVEELRALGYID